MGAHNGRIDHQPFHVGLPCERFEHGVEHTHLDPTIVAPLHSVGIAEPLGQIAPATARTRHPQQGIEKFAVIRPWAAPAPATTGNKQLQTLPLLVR